MHIHYLRYAAVSHSAALLPPPLLCKMVQDKTVLSCCITAYYWRFLQEALLGVSSSRMIIIVEQI